MKQLFLSLALLLLSKVDAIIPVTTYTFVDPCTPFVFMNAVQGKHGCYLFTAINGLLPGQEQGSYAWQFGDGASASGSLVAHCFNPETVTTVYTGTVSYNSPALCGVQPTDRTFTVTVPPVPTGSCIVISPDVLLSAQSVTVEGGIVIPEMLRRFNYDEGPDFEISPYHTYAGCGPFVITVKTWGMDFPDNICYAYHAVNLICKDVTTGIREDHPASARVYPNPCNERLFIETKKIPTRVTFIDVLGKTRLVESDVGSQRICLPAEQLDHGIFFVKIEYLDKSADVYKIMKD